MSGSVGVNSAGIEGSVVSRVCASTQSDRHRKRVDKYRRNLAPSEWVHLRISNFINDSLELTGRCVGRGLRIEGLFSCDGSHTQKKKKAPFSNSVFQTKRAVSVT